MKGRTYCIVGMGYVRIAVVRIEYVCVCACVRACVQAWVCVCVRACALVPFCVVCVGAHAPRCVDICVVCGGMCVGLLCVSVYLSTLYAFEQDKRKLDCVPENGREREQLTLYLPLILHPTGKKNVHNTPAFLEFVVPVAWTLVQV